MPSIKVVPRTTARGRATTQVQEAFGTGAPGALQIVAPRPRRAQVDRDRRGRPRRRAGHAGAARPRRRRARPGRSQAGPIGHGRRRDDRPAARRAAGRRARRRRGRREPRPRDRARGEDAAGDRRSARARVPAAPGRAAGAGHRRGRRDHQPARARRRVRRRPLDLPGGPPRRPARLRAAGLPERLGPGLLLRDGVRDLDGLHRVPAVLREGALGPTAAIRAKRWSAASRTPAGSSSPRLP